METTVAVVGAGPAGCAAALTLRRYLPWMPVMLVSAPAGAGPAAGETLSPGVLPLLDYLGLRAQFLDAGHLPAGGTASAWGSPHVAERSYLFTGRGTGWHLDRARFDTWMLGQAQSAGACVVHGRALLQGAVRSPSGWLLEVEGAGTVAARAVVDATGRSAQLARRLGLRPRRDDALVAEVRWFADDAPRRSSEGALVESVPDGWWYSASLPGARAVAMFMTDSDLLRQSAWEARLADAPATARRVERWHPAGETAVRAANSQLSPVVATHRQRSSPHRAGSALRHDGVAGIDAVDRERVDGRGGRLTGAGVVTGRHLGALERLAVNQHPSQRRLQQTEQLAQERADLHEP